jgi:hypothetical protein
MYKKEGVEFILKRWIYVLLSLLVVGLLTGCASSNAAAPKQESSSTKENSSLLSKTEMDQVYTDPNKFKGRTIELNAKIFADVERDDKGTYFQAFADPENSSKNTIVRIADSKLDIKQGDIVHIVGKIDKKFEGQNLMGGDVTAPVVTASKVEKTDYAAAFMPAINTIEVNKEINQNGYKIKLKKIEIAEAETRAYISITNDTKDKINFYLYESKIVQDSKQIKQETNYKAEYPDMQTDLLPGVKEDGIISFKPMNPKGKAKVSFEGSSDNYDIDIKPFVFDIDIK